jgi:spore maturation protein CgeB
MKFVLFYHSLVSDWNHGNAHFLRGIVTELLARGHAVEVHEPANGWSRTQLVAEYGAGAVEGFHEAYPKLRSRFYELESLDLDEELEGADVVIAHEWNEHELIARLGRHRAGRQDYRLFFHDTHHRAVTARAEMAAYDLAHYDGVLAYGAVLREIYLAEGWAQRAWVWHEAADVRLFRPHDEEPKTSDLVWIGNWGDDERTAELQEFLLHPIAELNLRAQIYGVRYPREALQALAQAGAHYGGWLPNFRAPREFARARLTVHVPRRPYATALRGIPTIRPFEALACGLPLISAPWEDAENLFTPGQDFLVARNGAEMRRHISAVLCDADLAQALRARGLATIHGRHTCAHRVDELLEHWGEVAPRVRTHSVSGERLSAVAGTR